MPAISAFGSTPIALETIVINLLLTLALSLAIALVYKSTHRGLSYSQSFVFTLIIASMITAMVMMVIGNNLALAFGLLGVFSIIRFRTAIKDSKDTGYIFFAMSSGMAVGTSSYTVAITGTVLILLVIIVLTRLNFGSMRKHGYLLSFVVTNGAGGNTFESVFRKYLKQSLLLNMNSKQDGRATEMTYQVSLVDEHKGNELVTELSLMTGVERVHLITLKEDVEY